MNAGTVTYLGAFAGGHLVRLSMRAAASSRISVGRDLRLRFGLDRGQPRTLDEVGEVFGLTRERIRQIEARAMSKLRHPSIETHARELLNV